MNLIFGNIEDDINAQKFIENLDTHLLKAKEAPPLTPHRVISACDKLSKDLSAKDMEILKSIGIPEYKAEYEFNLLKLMLSKEYLQRRLVSEFGSYNNFEEEYTPFGSDFRVKHKLAPLGTLFHISAGNTQLLAAYSIVEGLLCGNINIVKLDSFDDGLSVLLLKRLIDIEPELKDFIFVFNIASDNIDRLKKIASLSDAIIIWGGDEAVKAVRSFAPLNTQLIEWGHKISFAYISYGSNPDNIADEALRFIAYNICDTNQLFCNSCQGIFLDSESFDEVKAFSKRFLPLLEETAKDMPCSLDIHINAAKRLEVYTEALESLHDGSKLILQGENVNVLAYDNSVLKDSYMFRNPWIRPLKKEQILRVLQPYKNYLQTLALICPKHSRNEFEDIFTKTGIVRICNPENMSLNYCGMPHDGVFPLRRYMKVMSYEL